MSDAVLGILKAGWLALLYAFVLRVLFVVGKELKGSPLPAIANDRQRSDVKEREVKPPAKSTSSRWSLLVHNPEALRGVRVAVAQEVTIGRGGGCAIALPNDTFVSTVHARVVPRHNELWIEDLGSTNGTHVNDAMIDAPTKLKRGDRIQVGSSEIEVVR